jgi:hypothetical protein
MEIGSWGRNVRFRPHAADLGHVVTTWTKGLCERKIPRERPSVGQARRRGFRQGGDAAMRGRVIQYNTAGAVDRLVEPMCGF